MSTEIAFIFHLIILTGSSELTNTNCGTINKLAICYGLNKFLDFGYNLRYYYYGTGNDDLTYSLVLGLDLSDKSAMDVETFGKYCDLQKLPQMSIAVFLIWQKIIVN